MKRQHTDRAGSDDRAVKVMRRHAMAMLLALPLFTTTLAGCKDTASSSEATQPAGLVETTTTPVAVESETPTASPSPEPSHSPSPAPTTADPSPVPEPAPPAPVVAEPEPAPAPAAAQVLDPKFKYCKDAIPAGYGNYVKGVDPEYDWYRDADGDGVVCEF